MDTQAPPQLAGIHRVTADGPKAMCVRSLDTTADRDLRCPVQWTGQQAVVTFPQHIDISNVGQIREQLLWIINRGAAVLIADLTGTVSCDCSGADALARAQHRAVANGTELRLAVTANAVRRVLTLNGFDRLVAIYPDLDAAAAGTGRREQRTRTADDPARHRGAAGRRGGRTLRRRIGPSGSYRPAPGRHRAAHYRGPAPAR